jgi:hypothetical protein
VKKYLLMDLTPTVKDLCLIVLIWGTFAVLAACALLMARGVLIGLVAILTDGCGTGCSNFN